MRRTLALTGALTVLVGLVHVGVAACEYSAFTLDALWFVGSGIAVGLIGVLSLLASIDGPPVMRWAAAGANLLGLALAVGFLGLVGWQAPQGLALVVLFATGVVCTLRMDSARSLAR
ncbi:MAG: hypothetical protein K2Y26_05610 [Gemmatimonadaceae bacterium]|nr:hypothetical protein [Gemmatimonadaceae bacterium]